MPLTEILDKARVLILLKFILIIQFYLIIPYQM